MLLVLVVIFLLSVTAYNFSQRMLTEYEAAVLHAHDVQTRLLADAGVEYVATLLANRQQPEYENLYHQPQLFRGVEVSTADPSAPRGRFTILTPMITSDGQSTVRYGLLDESAKLNLNKLLKLSLTEDQQRDMLLALPGMTEEIADALLDWLDEDDNPRLYGVETDYYESLSPGYPCRNGPLTSLEELLLVRGVTPELLYGEDANRNGWLDPSENDGEVSLPYDNADGVLDLGWSAYLTIYSRELNLQTDGNQRINLNNGILTDLYDQLAAEFDEDVAKYIVAFRMSGPKDQRPTDSGSSTSLATSTTRGQQQQAQQQVVQGLASAAAQAVSAPGGKVTRGGLDLTGGAKYTIKSVWELIDSRCDAMVDGVQQTLTSPWSSSSSDLASLLPTIYDKLTVTPDLFIEGRINILQARPEILAGLPGMTDEVLAAIQHAQSITDLSAPSSTSTTQQTTGWLFLEGYVDIWTMRDLDPLITAGGDVFRAQVLGFLEPRGPVARVEAVIDGTQQPPRVVFYRDLSDLGRGYARDLLLGTP
ncbi:MAG: general secretion pathway protein GspK [Planctomycetaceae bacterium]|nr:MAG: general secretion pathway protein GspK [Planctomycetaceae bacterium]